MSKLYDDNTITAYNSSNMQKSAIKQLQQSLIDNGYSVGKSGVDGIWGKDTANAVRNYYNSIGYKVNNNGYTISDKAYNKLITPKNTSTTTSTTPATSSSATTTTTPASTTTTTPTTTTGTTTGTTTTSTETLTPGLNSDYNTMWEQYQKLLNNGVDNANLNYQNAQLASETALKAAKDANAESVNNNYDQSAKDYYSLYKQNQLSLPEQLSKYGITGGATETAQLGLMNNYATNLANNEVNRNNALYSNEADYNNQIAAMKQNYADLISENSTNVANQLASAYLEMAQNKYAQDLETAQTQAEEQEAAQVAQNVSTWNNNVQQRMNEQISKGNTVYYWKDDDGKYHWSTNQTKAATSGYTYKTLKPTTTASNDSDGTDDSNDNEDDNTLNQSLGDSYYQIIQSHIGPSTTQSGLKQYLQSFLSRQEDLNDATAEYIYSKFGF